MNDFTSADCPAANPFVSKEHRIITLWPQGVKIGVVSCCLYTTTCTVDNNAFCFAMHTTYEFVLCNSYTVNQLRWLPISPAALRTMHLVELPQTRLLCLQLHVHTSRWIGA